MVARGLKPASINTYLAIAKRIMAVAKLWGEVESDPWAEFKPLRVGKQACDFWLPEERDKFLRFCRAEDEERWRLYLVAAHTGMREGELHALRRGEIDFIRRRILVRYNYCWKTHQRLDRVKGGSAETVPMNPRVYEALQHLRLAPADARVFAEFSPNGACRTLRRIAQRAGVKPIRFHDLRHTFGTAMILAGVPTAVVQRVGRWASLVMVQRYVHLTADLLDGTTDVLVETDTQPAPKIVATVASICD
jgi:integrase